MALSRGRKRWVGVLGLAGMALVVDRVFLPEGEAHANAEDLLVHTEPAPRSVVQSSVSVEITTDLAERLRAYNDRSDTLPQSLPDAFAAPETWFSVTPVTYVDQNGTPSVVPHELSAVVNAADGGFAVIDGRPIKVGETRKNITLISIGNRTAEIEIGGVRHLLRIAIPELDR